MNDQVKMRFELEVMASRIISEYLIANESVQKSIEAGVKRAFENIDLEAEIEECVKGQIKRAIREATEWGKIREAVKAKTDELIEGMIEKSIKNILP